jgi:hypothetical protein
MSTQPPDDGSTPRFGWSLPPTASPLPPPPPPAAAPLPAAFGAPPSAPPPTTGFGGPPGRYIPGPLTASQIDAITPDPLPEPPPMWKRWWFVAAVVVVLAGGGALIWANSRDDAGSSASSTNGTGSDSVDTTSPASEPGITEPGITVPGITVPGITVPDLPPDLPPTVPGVPGIPPISVPDGGTPTGTPGNSAIGETVALADGGSIRLDSVTADAPPTQDIFAVDDGNVLTRLDFEVCAGSNGFSAFNPLFWVGTLDDGTEATPFLFSFPILVVKIAPGACGRSQIDLQAPAGRPIVTVGARDYLFQVVAAWDTTIAPVAVDGPLASASPVSPSPRGTAVDLPGGGTITVRSASAPEPPLDPTLTPTPGYQYVHVDLEVCAGSTPVSFDQSNVFGATSDHRLGGASGYGSTFPADDTPAGACRSGIVELQLPDGAPLLDVFVSDAQTTEVARWRLG